MRDACFSETTDTCEDSTMLKGFEDWQKLSQKNIDAAMRSAGELNRNGLALAEQMTKYSMKAFEEGTEMFEKLLSAKSLDEAIEIQTNYAKNAFEAYMAQLGKLTETFSKIATEAYQAPEPTKTNRTRKS